MTHPTDYDIFPKEIADTLRLNDQQVFNNGAAITLEEEVPFEDGIHTYIAVKFPLQHIVLLSQRFQWFLMWHL